MTLAARDHFRQQVRIERTQIVDPFAYADRVDRQAILLGRGDQHPAARGAVIVTAPGATFVRTTVLSTPNSVVSDLRS